MSQIIIQNLKTFIKNLILKILINYDSVSASLNYDATKNSIFTENILKIYVKDRIINGIYRLGKGNANFPKIFKNIKKMKYNNYYLQTARSQIKKKM